jgi:hypothetical protein
MDNINQIKRMDLDIIIGLHLEDIRAGGRMASNMELVHLLTNKKNRSNVDFGSMEIELNGTKMKLFS